MLVYSDNAGGVLSFELRRVDGAAMVAPTKEAIFELGVTSRPTSVGYGLALARKIVRDEGGRFTWPITLAVLPLRSSFRRRAVILRRLPADVLAEALPGA